MYDISAGKYPTPTEVRPNHLVQHDGRNIPPTDSHCGSISYSESRWVLMIRHWSDRIRNHHQRNQACFWIFLHFRSLPMGSFDSNASISSTAKHPLQSLHTDSTLSVRKCWWSRWKLLPHALNVVDPAAALQQRPNITIEEEFSKFHNRAILPWTLSLSTHESTHHAVLYVPYHALLSWPYTIWPRCPSTIQPIFDTVGCHRK